MVNRKTKRVKEHKRGVMKFNDWKQQAIEMLISDDVLTKLLQYNTPNALSKNTLTEDEKYELVDSKIFGYRYNPTPKEKQESYIGMGFSNFVPQEGFRQFSDDFVMGYMYIYILVDNQIMSTDRGYRQDLILDRVYDIFEGSRDFGMGELRMETQLELWTQNNNYGGYSVGFRIVEMK